MLPSQLWILNSLSLVDVLPTLGFFLESFFDFSCSCLVVSDPDICYMLNPDPCDAWRYWLSFLVFEVRKLPMPTCVLDIIFTQIIYFSFTGPPLDDLAAFIFSICSCCSSFLLWGSEFLGLIHLLVVNGNPFLTGKNPHNTHIQHMPFPF